MFSDVQLSQSFYLMLVVTGWCLLCQLLTVSVGPNVTVLAQVHFMLYQRNAFWGGQ